MFRLDQHIFQRTVRIWKESLSHPRKGIIDEIKKIRVNGKENAKDEFHFKDTIKRNPLIKLIMCRVTKGLVSKKFVRRKVRMTSSHHSSYALKRFE